MNLVTLRRWVRRELPPAERREVGRWIVRCPDPELPHVLYGLIKEQEQEIADARLLATHPGQAELVGLWHRLWEAGRALLEPLEPAEAFGAATLSPGEMESRLVLRRSGEVVAIDLVVATDRGEEWVVVFASTDAGETPRLYGPIRMAAGSYPETETWLPEPGEGRVRLWMVTADPQAVDAGEIDTLIGCAQLADTGRIRMSAYGWIDED